jgi:hypothetical protein
MDESNSAGTIVDVTNLHNWIRQFVQRHRTVDGCYDDSAKAATVSSEGSSAFLCDNVWDNSSSIEKLIPF